MSDSTPLKFPIFCTCVTGVISYTINRCFRTVGHGRHVYLQPAQHSALLLIRHSRLLELCVHCCQNLRWVVHQCQNCGWVSATGTTKLGVDGVKGWLRVRSGGSRDLEALGNPMGGGLERELNWVVGRGGGVTASYFEFHWNGKGACISEGTPVSLLIWMVADSGNQPSIDASLIFSQFFRQKLI